MKKVTLIILTAWALLCNTPGAGAQPEAKDTGKNGFELYILMGQSNMAGRGKLTEAYRNDTNHRVLMLTKEKRWVTARHPVHYDKTIAGVGPGLQFGFFMASANPAVKIGLIPAAVGGTSISVWQPGAFDSSTKTHPYDDAVDRIKEGIKYGIVKGIIWLQGESDVNTYNANSYLRQLKVLVDNVRSVLNNPQLPFIAGELGRYRKTYTKFNRRILKKIPRKIRYTKLVKSYNFIHGGDSTHFDAYSAEMYGKRFGQAMVKLQKKIR